jgi:hypothetical protein
MMVIRKSSIFLLVAAFGSASSASAQTSPQASPPTSPGKPESSKRDSCIDAAEQGERLQASGKLLEARERFVTCGNSACPRVIQSECIKWLAKTEEAIPTVVVRVSRASGEDISEGSATLDGDAAYPFDGRPLSVDPGPHQLTVTAWGETVSTSFVAVQGEKRKVVSIKLAAKVVSKPVKLAERSIWPGLVVTSAGVVLGVTGGVFWGLGRGEHASLRDGCARSSSCNPADVSAAKRSLAVGDVLFFSGIVAVGVGTFLLVQHALGSSSAAKRTGLADSLQLKF